MKRFFTILILISFIILNTSAKNTKVRQLYITKNNKVYINANNREYEALPIVTVKFLELQALQQKYNVIRYNKLKYADIKPYSNLSLDEFTNLLEEDTNIQSVDYNSEGEYNSLYPNDPYLSNQWYLSAIRAHETWDITTGSPQIKVGVLDSGTDWLHPDLGEGSDFYQNIYCNPNEDDWSNSNNPTTGNNIDDDNNNLVDDYKGWNFAMNTNDCRTTAYHGTFVAGIIGAKTNNATGIAGIAGGYNSQGVSILPYCVGVQNPESDIIDDAIIAATDNGCRVIQFSLSIPNTSAVNAALEYARAQNVIVVCSSGNNYMSSISYPASHPSVIAVGAVSENRRRADFSNYGTNLSLVAPGVNIYSTMLTSNMPIYNYGSGTSFSAPQVSAVIALMLSVNPHISYDEVRYIIESTAQKIEGYTFDVREDYPNGTWNQEVGYGLLDAYAAVTKAKDFPIRGPEKINVSATYSLVRPSQPGETVSWSIHNGEMYNPFFYIVGPTNLDSVVVQYNDVVLSSNNDGSRGLIDIPDRPFPMDSSLVNNQKYLSVTITSANGSKTYTKPLYIERNNKPTITVSDTALLWRANSTRVFNITNCANVSDSLLRWTVARYSQAAATPQISNYYGRTLTYTPSAPPRISMDSLTVYATNLTDNIGNGQSKILRFIIFRPIHIITSIENDILNVSLVEDEVNQTAQRAEQLLDPNKNYTIELWHSMYGKQYAGNMRNSKEQINISGLPSGTYVLLLKDGNSVATQTKVLIQ